MNMSARKKSFLTVVLLVLIVGAGAITASCSSGAPETQWEINCESDLLRELETSDKEFEIYERGDAIFYYYKRMIDEATVAFDRLWYKFDKNTGELIEKDIHWRRGLPEHLPLIISREEAESMVEGETDSSTLYYISPESDVFPIKPTPKNPCWVVWLIGDRGYISKVIVIDAVEGKILGHGVPPP